ncbi:MAG TPA: SbcC/MukB-like Walker B domain-containing protein, partial [Thermoplasmataceae archaeon]|nr:SbcC/MukB-like Walker B domain-containing protein [Thermoplasmataceae archaeon]
QPVRDRYLLLTSKKETLLKEDDGIREAAASHANSLKTIRSLESEIKGLEDQFLNLSAKIIRDTGISGFSDQEVNQRISELGAELRSLEDQLTREAGLILGLESKLLEIREHRSIVSGKNTCPVCGQPLTSDHMNELMKGWLEQESRIGLELEERRRLQDELRERIRATKWVRDYFHSKSFNEARNLITRIENRKRDLDAERRKAEESEGSFRRHAEILSEIGGIEQEIMSLSEGNDAWEQLDSNLKGFDVEDARSRKAGLSQRIREISEQISEVERSSGFRIEPSLMVRIQENDALYSEISRLESDRKKAAGILEGYRSNIESLEKDIQSLEESIVPLDELQRKLNEMVQERNSLREFEKTIRTDLQTKQANFQVSNQRIEDTQKQISVIEGKLRRRELMRVRRETLEKIRRCLGRDGIQRAIRQEAAEYISRKVHDYVSAFSLGVADVKVSDDMDIEVSMGDHTENIAMLSGGERTALSVALRLALARYLAENVNTILMDEPTNFLDSERRDNLRDILKTAFGKDRISPQLIMVTHHHELVSAANVAYSIVKRDGTSYLENFF